MVIFSWTKARHKKSHEILKDQARILKSFCCCLLLGEIEIQLDQ